MGTVIMGPFTPEQALRDLFFFGSALYFMMSLFLGGLGSWAVKLFWRYIPLAGLIASAAMIGMGIFGYLPGWIAVNGIWPFSCAIVMLAMFHLAQQDGAVA